MTRHKLFPDDSGAALLIALLVLTLFSLLGLFMSLNATTGVQISDNYESQLQATYAALAGLNHARALLRGLSFNDLLRGPDGVYDSSEVYLAKAKSYQFRSPFTFLTAQTLNILDPSSDVAAFPDDGVINTGAYGGLPGTALIPKTGVSQTAPNPYGPGMIVTSRYFVKVTDNNKEPSEIAGDVDDNPFVDGDGIIIVRSMGIAKTISDLAGATRRNSVAVFEARFKRPSTWDLGSALVTLGNGVAAAFSGPFEISGGAFPGIATIDPVSEDAIFPDRIVRAAAAGTGDITGGGEPNPSVLDITGKIKSNRDQLQLLSPGYLWSFVHNQAPRIADSFYDGNQNWMAGSAPYLGFYDPAKPLNAPGQDPKIAVVNGDLQVTGSVSGGGLLIVTGGFSCSGPFAYNGLILLIGAGNLNVAGSGFDVEGGVIAANLTNAGGEIAFGTPSIAIDGKSRISANRDAVRMAVGLIPPSQIGFREITGSDP